MPQLIRTLQSERGSVLVMAVAFSIVMAIAGSALMMISGNSVNHEAAAFNNDKAFLTAESGLMIGERWLEDSANWNQYKSTGKPLIYTGTINGIIDTVLLALLPDGSLELQSVATGEGVGFTKRISWGIKKMPNPGIFINDMDPDQKGVGQGGLDNIWMDGPFHSNMPIYLSAVSNSKANGASVYFLNGPVTVHNKTIRENFDVGHMGDYGTGGSGSYEFGIKVKSGQSQGDHKVAADLDNTFQQTFTHSQDSLYMERINGQDQMLPFNHSTTHRALLYYDTIGGIGYARYFYYTATGVRTEAVYAVNKRVLRAQNAVSVLGIVKGQTTLVTNPGYNIYPVGDITYADFSADNEAHYDQYDNSNNYGVGFIAQGHTNILALFSGADIHFAYGNKQLFNRTTTTLYDAPDDEVLYVTACMYAIEAGYGLMWDTKNMTGEPKDFLQSKCKYTLRVIGSRTIDHFFNFMDGGGTNANNKIRFFMDSRIFQDLRAPGVQGFKRASSTTNGLFDLKKDWREQNIPISL